MNDTSKELSLYKRMADELAYAADKLFAARKGLSGIYDAETSAEFCLDNLFQPFSNSYYDTTESFLKDVGKCKDEALKLERLLAKLEVSLSERSKDFARRIIKLEKEEEE